MTDFGAFSLQNLSLNAFPLWLFGLGGFMALRVDADLFDISRCNAGLIPFTEAAKRGISRHAIARRITAGVLLRAAPGVLYLAATGCPPEHRARAAASVCRQSWVSHTSAAALWGATLRVVRPEISLPSPMHAAMEEVACHRRTNPTDRKDLLVRRDLGMAFTLTRPAATLVDLASSLKSVELELTLDAWLLTRTLTLNHVIDAANRRGRFRGLVVLRELVNDRANGLGVVRSWLEQRVGAVIRKAGLPAPIRNYPVQFGRRRRIVDLAWPDHRVGVEADSWRHHSSPTDWGRTRVRDREFVSHGWRLLPCVAADTRDPSKFLSDLRAALGV